jgi:hypothetical protein
MAIVSRRRSRSILLLCLLLSFVCFAASFRFGFSLLTAKEKSSYGSSSSSSNNSEEIQINTKQQQSTQNDQVTPLTKEEDEGLSTRTLSNESIRTSLLNEIDMEQKETSWLDGLKLEEYSLEQQQQLDNKEHVFPPLPDHMLQNPLLQVPCSLQVESSSSSSMMITTAVPLQQPLVYPVVTFVDTGAQVTILSWRAAQRARLLHLMDRRFAGHAIGVGHCRVLGRIPAGALRLHLHGHTVPSPAITILDVDDTTNNMSHNQHHINHDGGDDDDEHHASSNTNNNNKSSGVELLLGLDFLRDYHAILDLRQGEMRLLVDISNNKKNQPQQQLQEEVVIPFLLPRSRLDAQIMTSQQQQQQQQRQLTPMLQQCKSWILPLGDYEDDEGDDDQYNSDLESSNSAEPIDMSGV